MNQEIPLVFYLSNNKIRINPLASPYLLHFIWKKWMTQETSTDNLSVKISFHAHTKYIDTLREKLWKQARQHYSWKSSTLETTKYSFDDVGKRKKLESILMDVLPNRNIVRNDISFSRIPLFTIESNEISVIYIMSLEVVHIVKDDVEEYILLSNTSLGPVMKKLMDKTSRHRNPVFGFTTLWPEEEMSQYTIEQTFRMCMLMKKESSKGQAKFLLLLPFLIHLNYGYDPSAWVDHWDTLLEKTYNALLNDTEVDNADINNILTNAKTHYNVSQIFNEQTLHMLGKKRPVKRPREEEIVEVEEDSVKKPIV